jgi:electron-transferring-flavoprotein dehydrogenase
VLIATETPAQTPLLEDGRVLGVRTGDKGIDKHGNRKGTYQPGADCLAKVTVLCEGPRGTVAKQLESALGLTAGKQPQVYATGVKELWRRARRPRAEGSRHPHAQLAAALEHVRRWFRVRASDSLWYVGFATGLDTADPTNDPARQPAALQDAPDDRGAARGWKPVAYGAKAIPEGGWYSMPKLYADGLLLAGDTGGFLNGGR